MKFHEANPSIQHLYNPSWKAGENLAHQILFDIAGWQSEYGAGIVELLHKRPGEDVPYPVAVSLEGSTVVWDITSADTECAERNACGKAEMRYYVGNVLAISQTWKTTVEPNIGVPGEPLKPELPWLEQVLAAGAAAKEALALAEAAAIRGLM